MTGLYLHIPFCVRKCLYCDFYSIETGTGPIAGRLTAPQSDNQTFLDALAIELAHAPDSFAPSTIFIGGGTPTELSDRDLRQLFDLLRTHVDLSQVEEWTCECNPGTLTSSKADILRAGGVNRVSLGVQSFDPENLEFLGRIHGPDDVRDSYALLRSAGFDNMNLDIIYGIPKSTLEKTVRDIETIIELAPEHTSCYCLTFEEGTPLMRLKERGFVREMDDESERAEYAAIRERLQQSGYAQYEISNFAQPGRSCRHNLLYWGNGSYIGCGPAAHSHWNGQRYSNVRSLKKYCDQLLNGQPAVDFEETLDPENKARETLVMWLRRMEGVPRADFRSTTGFDYHELAGDTITHLCNIGMLAEEHDTLRLTEEGLFVSNSVFAELV